MPPKGKSKPQSVKRIRLMTGQGRDQDKKQFKRPIKEIKTITKGDIRRLARRGGVKRISGDVYELSKMYMKMYISNILRDSMIFANYAKRTTLLSDDVIRAAKRIGQNAIGFSEAYQ